MGKRGGRGVDGSEVVEYCPQDGGMGKGERMAMKMGNTDFRRGVVADGNQDREY